MFTTHHLSVLHSSSFGSPPTAIRLGAKLMTGNHFQPREQNRINLLNRLSRRIVVFLFTQDFIASLS
jgi:hypothetical protein